MSNNVRRVLDLLSSGKVTVVEADALIAAVNATGSATADATRPARYFRISVSKAATGTKPEKEKKVSIRVPAALVRGGMRLGSLLPGLSGEELTAHLRERGIDIDLAKLDKAAVDRILSALAADAIEIDTGEARLQITAE